MLTWAKQLVVGFFWQFLTLYDKRLFRGRQLPNWAIAVMETLGYVAFLVLLVSNAVAIDARRPYGDLANPDEMMLVIYASAVWIILWYVLASFPLLVAPFNQW